MPGGSGKSNTFKLQVALIFSFSFFVYLNTLFNGFVYDDRVEILQNPWIKDIRKIPLIFSSGFWEFAGHPGKYYRPLMHMGYMLDYHLFGLNAWGFHLTQILLHGGVSVLVFLLAREVLKKKEDGFFTPALFASLLFAAHPVHTESVSWLAGIADLSFSLFLLMSLLFYIRSGTGVFRPVLYLLSVLSFFLAVFFKEPAVVLPAILLAYDISSGRMRPFSGLIKRYIPFLVVLCFYFVIRVNVLGGVAQVKAHSELGQYLLFLNIFPLFAGYVLKLFLPLKLNAYHVFRPFLSVSDPLVILSIIGGFVFLLLLIFSFRKEKGLFFSLAIFIIPLLPVLYIPGVGENTFAERYLYLPSAGFAMALAWAFQRAGIFSKPKIALLVSSVILALCAGQTVNRNAVWHDDITLWEDTAGKSPDSELVHYNLGVAYRDANLPDKAIPEFRKSLELNPGYVRANLALAIIYGNTGKTDDEIREYENALSLQPDPSIYNDLGVAYMKKEMFRQAVENFEKALAMNPGNLKMLINLGTGYLRSGELDKSETAYRKAIQIKDNPVAHLQLAKIYSRRGQAERAGEETRLAGKFTVSEAR